MVLGVCLLVLTLYLPTAFVSEQYFLPFPLTTCTEDCPTNAFMLTNSEPAFLGGVEDVRDVLAIGLFIAAVSILALRIKRETPLVRPILVPVLAIAIVRLVAVAVYQLMAGTYPDSSFTEVAGWMAAFGIPAMSIAFLVGADPVAHGRGDDARAGHGRTARRSRSRDPRLAALAFGGRRFRADPLPGSRGCG